MMANFARVLASEVTQGVSVALPAANTLWLHVTFSIGKRMGKCGGPRTCPPAQVTAPELISSNSGVRSNHTRNTTSISMRAGFDPAQRRMPTPNAMWRLRSRSMMHSSAL
jgi:hypothetical protein